MSKRAEERALEAYPILFSERNGINTGMTSERNAFAYGYEAAQKDLGWISVKERLPEKTGWYYSCNDDDGSPTAIGISEWDLNGWKDVGGLPDSPDYWMPIPELPKKQ